MHQALAGRFRWNSIIPAERIHISVSKGWVTLEDEVPHHAQQADGESAADAGAARHLGGLWRIDTSQGRGLPSTLRLIGDGPLARGLHR